MNQDQVHDLLLTLKPEVANFSVIFSEKSSRKVHGLYKPATQEILLHNRNFTTEQELLYTAIHEFAHHVHFTSKTPPQSARSHTGEFWSIFHDLLQKAHQSGWYPDIFETDPSFMNLTKTLKENYLKPHGELMKEFGRLLCQAVELCSKHGVPFEDYRDRILGLPRTTTKVAMTAYRWDVPTEYGWDAMKVLSSVPQAQKRHEMLAQLADGASLDQLKVHNKAQEIPQDLTKVSADDPKIRQQVLERKIRQLEKQLSLLNEQLRILKQDEPLSKRHEDGFLQAKNDPKTGTYFYT